MSEPIYIEDMMRGIERSMRTPICETLKQMRDEGFAATADAMERACNKGGAQ